MIVIVLVEIRSNQLFEILSISANIYSFFFLRIECRLIIIDLEDHDDYNEHDDPDDPDDPDDYNDHDDPDDPNDHDDPDVL